MMTQAEQQAARDFAAEVQQNNIGIKVTTHNIGRQRRFNPKQKRQTAELVGAKDQNVYGGTKLYATNDPHIKRIGTAINNVRAYWRAMTIDYPGLDGVRLLRSDRLDEWVEDWETLQKELAAALQDAEDHRDEILDRAYEALKREVTNPNFDESLPESEDNPRKVTVSAFDPANYPASFTNSVTMEWSVHNYEADERLAQLAPNAYRREKQRVRNEMDEIVAVFEEQMIGEMMDLLDAMLKRLQPENGKAVRFNESAANNLRKFFEQFRQLNIGSNQELTELVEQAEQTLGATSMKELKSRPSAKRTIAASFNEIKEQLDTMMVEAPARSISLDDLED